MKTILNQDQLFDAQQEIFDRLKSHEKDLESIRLSNLPLVNKWQNFLQIILPIQLEVVKSRGFGDDHSALSKFNEQYSNETPKNPSLKELNEKKWSFLFEKAFGLKEVKQISMTQAKSLITDIATAMTSEDFLKQIDVAMADLGQEASLLSKRQKLLEVLFPLHMSIMAKHGFSGEEGYVQAQRALMDYYHISEIIEKANYAQKVVFARCKLI